jgi:GNAT superfamily N-acetyltransferase
MTLSRSGAAIEIRPLTAARMPDYLRFFDTRAFTDNPRWASCYCFFPHHDPAVLRWPERSALENRQAMCERIGAGDAMGYLAFDRGDAIGWCNAGPRRLYPMLRAEPREDAARVGAIFCFLVAPEYRRHGVATALLDAACAGLKAAGMRVAEARPQRGATGAAQNHLGPLPMFLAAGFAVVREDEDGTVHVERRLA